MTKQMPIAGTFSSAKPDPQVAEAIEVLSREFCSRYVRREHRFYHVSRPNMPLDRRDVEQTFLIQAQTIPLNTPITPDILRQVFDDCINVKQTDKTKSIPVWGGEMVCLPGNNKRIVWLDTGSVQLNTWVEPAYRKKAENNGPPRVC